MTASSRLYLKAPAPVTPLPQRRNSQGTPRSLFSMAVKSRFFRSRLSGIPVRSTMSSKTSVRFCPSMVQRPVSRWHRCCGRMASTNHWKRSAELFPSSCQLSRTSRNASSRYKVPLNAGRLLLWCSESSERPAQNSPAFEPLSCRRARRASSKSTSTCALALVLFASSASRVYSAVCASKAWRRIRTPLSQVWTHWRTSSACRRPLPRAHRPWSSATQHVCCHS
mmetsp:Transcript_106831/g.276171  ORF Transcript_106831/g.276171 Transcript_106831/m.276171 type:complete len:224 (-) Transcript_106831:890-1561(-)